MEKQQYLFNEDVKKLKQISIALEILFLICAIIKLNSHCSIFMDYS